MIARNLQRALVDRSTKFLSITIASCLARLPSFHCLGCCSDLYQVTLAGSRCTKFWKAAVNVTAYLVISTCLCLRWPPGSRWQVTETLSGRTDSLGDWRRQLLSSDYLISAATSSLEMFPLTQLSMIAAQALHHTISHSSRTKEYGVFHCAVAEKHRFQRWISEVSLYHIPLISTDSSLQVACNKKTLRPCD